MEQMSLLADAEAIFNAAYTILKGLQVAQGLKDHHYFDTEDEACQAAAWIDKHPGDMEDIFDGENPHHQQDETESEETSGA